MNKTTLDLSTDRDGTFILTTNGDGTVEILVGSDNTHAHICRDVGIDDLRTLRRWLGFAIKEMTR